MGWLSRKTPVPSGVTKLDIMVLDQLKKAGSDLTQPHEVDNFLYFADEASAQEAANRLASASKTVATSPPVEGKEWLTKAIVVVVPTAANIAEMRARMEAIAHALRGDYDGWGAPIVPRR